MEKKSSAEEYDIEIQIAPEFTGSEYAHILTQKKLEAVVLAVLRHEERQGEITLVITDDQSIHDLNREFLGQDGPTDVLAFAAQEEAGPFVSAPEADLYLGDVIVSYPRAVAQAEEMGHPAEQELDLLIVHGILHLLGYDHATEEEKATMWARQEAILQAL